MGRKYFQSGLFLGLIFLFFYFQNSVFAQSRIITTFGKAQVEGQDVFVHIWLLVPPGADAAQIARAALADQGARPVRAAEFKTTGLVWDQFFDGDTNTNFVTQYYNASGDPTGGAAEESLLNSNQTWTNVSTSNFAFLYGGWTDRCPSLVRECPGSQTFDGFNDIAWLDLRGCCTLAVTWFGTGIDEADMAMNRKFSWSTNGVDDFDVETVLLHEQGHVLGLDHSEFEDAVMYAYYQGVRQALHSDDIAGVTYLYPADGATGAVSGFVINWEDGAPIAGAVVEVGATSLFAVSESDGYYFLDGVPEGTYDVTASADGFVSQTISEVSVVADATTPLDFALEPGPSDPTPSDGTVTVDSISYATAGGRNRHLLITVGVLDGGGSPVSGAAVSVRLDRNGGFVGSATGTTGEQGTVTFRLNNASSGCYETTITDVSAENLNWDGVTPPNGFCK